MLRSLRFALVAAFALSLAAASPVFSAGSRAAFAQPPAQSSSVAPDPPATSTAPATVSPPQVDPKPGTFVVVKDGAATVSGGSLAGELLMWLVLLVGAPLAGLIAVWVIRLLKKLGVEVSDADRARLQEMVENGLALAAQRAQANLKEKLPLNIKSAVAVDALQYVQDHGAETLKILGFDPKDPIAIEAVQARIAKAMDDKVPPPTVVKSTV